MTEGIDDTSQFRDVSQCFVEAVRRSMRVANEDEDGLPDALSQTELAERAAMGRSTLAKYLGGRSDEAPANPDLDIICRLAHAVGVPPAILLMPSALARRSIMCWRSGARRSARMSICSSLMQSISCASYRA